MLISSIYENSVLAISFNIISDINGSVQHCPASKPTYLNRHHTHKSKFHFHSQQESNSLLNQTYRFVHHHILAIELQYYLSQHSSRIQRTVFVFDM